MSEQSKQSRFAAAGQAPRTQRPIGAPAPLAQAKKAASLAELLRASASPLARAVPFPERLTGAIPSIRAPKPRVVPGPTPKRKLPESIEKLSFLPTAKPEIPASASGSSADSPFHPKSQVAPDTKKPTIEQLVVDQVAAESEKPSSAGAVSPFSINTQAFDTSINRKESAPEVTTSDTGEDGIIDMRPRTTIVPKGGLSGGNSPFSNIQPQAFTPSTTRSGQASNGKSPFAFPAAEALTVKREQQPTSISAPFSLTPPAELAVASEPETAGDITQEDVPVITDVPAPKSDEILYVPETEEEADAEPTHRPILPLHVEPVFTAPPTTTHIGAWDSTDSLLSDAEPSAEAEEALRAADYGYVEETPAPEADDYAWYTPEEQPIEPVDVPEVAPAAITEVHGKEHYSYPAVKSAYDRAEDIPAFKKQMSLALTGGWIRVLLLLVAFSASLFLSLADLFSVSLPTILSPDIYPLIYRMADLELLLLAILLCFPLLRDGLTDLLHGHATPSAFFAAPTLLFLLVQIAEICYGTLTDGAPSVSFPLYSAPILLGCVLAALGHVLELHRQNTIFRHVAAGFFAYTVEAEPDGSACMRETTFPTNVAAHIAQPTPSSSVSAILLPLLLLLSLACGIVGGVHLSSVVGGLYAGALALAACFPLGRILVRSGGALFRTAHALSTYGSCALSEVDAKKLAATDSLSLSEAALFANSQTKIARIFGNDEEEKCLYVLQAIGDAIGGGMRIGLQNRFQEKGLCVPHTDRLAKTGGDEDGVELSIDDGRVLHIGRHTFMLRHRMSPLSYTEDDARADRQSHLQVLFVAEGGVILRKVHLYATIDPSLRADMLALTATGKEILIETDSPFFDEERLHVEFGETRVPIHVSHRATSLCAPIAKPTQGGLLAASTDGAVALLTELSSKQVSVLHRALLTTISVALGLGAVATALFSTPIAPFVAPVLCAVQLLHLPLSRRHFKRKD